ncbi:HTH domain-containing protein [Enterocloster lavalensis]|uniref:HTH domain-containing protein n=1 Tax=Enterocloster lavalensis TaxID=460384 RepID=UPI002A83D14E|nr:HTH domain-containing protein [Enterocloster lavalensis]
MAQLEKRKAVILNTLLEREDYITAQQLAAIAGASVRTIKSDIAALNKLVENCGVQIRSVPNRGYRLEQGEDADLSELSLMMDDSELRRFYKVPQDANERIYYLIRKLLVVDYPLETGELADEIYVSEPTVVRDLQKARIILAKRNLKLVMEKKGNVRLEGSELNKRLAISEFFSTMKSTSARRRTCSGTA